MGGGRNGNVGVQSLFCSLLLGALLVSVCHGLTNNMEELSDFFSGLSPQSKLNWPQSDPCGSSWNLVSCTGADVTAIFIKGLGLTGTLRPSLTQLPMLTRLDAQVNSLEGPLPTFNGTSAPLITTLFLGSNQFSAIPADFFKGLTALRIFSLDKNPLAAWPAPDLSNNPMLVNFTISNCGVTGPIPDTFGSLTSLTTLSMSYNSLTGPLPPSLASGRALSVLQLNNQAPPGLSGNLSILGDLLGLTVAWLHGNSFSGPLPDNLPSGLQDLRLNNNQLVGPLPPSMASLTALQTLYIQNNHLSGPLPSFPNNKLDLTKDDTDFCGASCNPEVDALLVFLADLGYPQSLAMAWVGPDPCAPWKGIVCDTAANPSITVINLPLQQLTGSISLALGNLTGLQQIVLYNNSLTGTIPDLSGLPQLVKMDVRYNSLSPPVPSFPPRVTVLTVGNPAIDALSIPPSVPPSVAPGATPPVSPAAPPSVSPAAPPSVSPAAPPSVSPPVTAAPGSAPGSDAPGSAPGGTSKPSPPSGTPPGKTGAAPSSGDAAGAVAGSSKSSSIPVAAVAGPVVGVVSFLVLAGVLFYCCYQKKRKGFLRVPSSTTSVMIHPRDSSSDPEVVKIVVGGSAGAASKTHSRTSSGPSDVTVVGEPNNLVISIEVLRDVTKNFSDENVLGRGGFGVVYKGQLEDGTMIAVKRMEAAVVSSKGLSEFQAEIAVLTKVRHRHLVALLGYCVEGNERLLVYEYMPQGTLSQHLFDWKSHDEKPLPWKKRLSIALDVARGMEYLHGLAHKSFIHRDLKPSNILLGDDFRAKVSDFGLVKLAPEGKYSVETRLAGTFGYLAPEYAVTGRVTTKADVFSFGVVLMELVTGRRALDETQPEENMHLVTWFRRTNTNKDNFMKAIDSSIELNEETLQTVLIVAELAGHCTAPEPYQRPDMGHAVNVLAPLVEMWKPSNYDPEDNAGINMELSLPQALKQWQALGDLSMTSSLDDTKTSLPTGFADSFTSADGR